MTPLGQFVEAWPMPWVRRGPDTLTLTLDSYDEIHVHENNWGVWVRYNGGLLGYERMPGVLLTVKKALLEEAYALRQRLDALDEAISLLNTGDFND